MSMSDATRSRYANAPFRKSDDKSRRLTSPLIQAPADLLTAQLLSSLKCCSGLVLSFRSMYNMYMYM